VHPTQIMLWKKDLIAQAAGILDSNLGPKPEDPFASPERLYFEIGRLKMELDWLKISPCSPAEERKRLVSMIGPLAVALSKTDNCKSYAGMEGQPPVETELGIDHFYILNLDESLQDELVISNPYDDSVKTLRNVCTWTWRC